MNKDIAKVLKPIYISDIYIYNIRKSIKNDKVNYSLVSILPSFSKI